MKDKIINSLKFYLFVILTVSGIVYNLMLIWVAFGLPTTTWAFLLLFGVSGLLDWLYIKWLSR